MIETNKAAQRRVMRPRVLWQVIKVSGLLPTTILFVGLFGVSALAVAAVEPGIVGVPNAAWFLFEAVTTIGFGDYECVTAVGRIITVVISLYAMFFFALCTSALVSYGSEIMRARKNESTAALLDKLERLPELSHDELVEISNYVKRL